MITELGQNQVVVDRFQLLSIIACVVATYIAYSTVIAFFSAEACFFRRQIRAGRKGWFSTLDTILGSRAILAEGYSKWSKAGKIFALPNFGGKTFIMMPQNRISELIDKQDSEVSSRTVFYDELAVEYQGDMDVDGNPLHFKIVRRQLTRKLPLFTEPIFAELKDGFETEWKNVNAKEWTDIPAFESCAKIVSRAANRIFCELTSTWYLL